MIYKGRTKVTIEFLNYFKQPWLNISGFGESEGNEIRTRIPNSEMQIYNYQRPSQALDYETPATIYFENALQKAA